MPRMKYTKSSLKRYDLLRSEQEELKKEKKFRAARDLEKLINFYFFRSMFYGFQRK